MKNEENPGWDDINPKAVYKIQKDLNKVNHLADRWTGEKKVIMHVNQKKVAIERCKSKKTDDKTKSLEEILKMDKEVSHLCKDKNIDEIIEVVKNLVFEKRKMIDKVNLEILKLKEEQTKDQDTMNLLKKQLQDSTLSKLDKACNEAELELENISTQKDAATIMLNSCTKLTDLLVKENLHYDSISHRIKTLILIQAEFFLYVMDVLKWATFDYNCLRKIKQLMTYTTSEITKTNKGLKKMIKSAIQEKSTVFYPENVQMDPNVASVQTKQLQQYDKAMIQLKVKWDNYFQQIRDACHVSKDSDIIFSLEKLLQYKHYLSKLIDMDNLLVDHYVKKNKYIQQTLDSVIFTLPKSTHDFRRVRNIELKQKEKVDSIHKTFETKRRYDMDSPIILKFLTFLLYHYFKQVNTQPYLTYKRNREVYNNFLNTSAAEDEDENGNFNPIDLRAPQQSEILRLELETFNQLKVPHILDSITLKAKSIILRRTDEEESLLELKPPPKKCVQDFKEFIRENESLFRSAFLEKDTSCERRVEFENFLYLLWEDPKEGDEIFDQ